MAAHSLDPTRTELLRVIASIANFHRDPDDWSTDQKTDGFDVLKDALLQAYFPQIVGNDNVPWEWSWLKISHSLQLRGSYSTGTVAIAANGSGSIVTLTDGTWPSWADEGEIWIGGSRYTVLSRTSDSIIRLDDTAVTVAAGTSYSLRKSQYTLPDDYGSMYSEGFTYRRGSTEKGSITLLREAALRRLDQPDISGPARHAAIMPMAPNDDTESTRWYATFWPHPTADVVVDYVYQASPPTISSLGTVTNIYAYGGPAYAGMIRASVEDKAYQKFHRSEEKHGAFLEQLYRAVRLDQRRNGSFTLGMGSKSLAPSGPCYEEALYDHRANSPNVHDNINFG
jgi:hypothetical protein